MNLDHVTLVAADLERSTAFYDDVLGAAGIGRVVAYQDFEDEAEVGEEAVGYGAGDVVVLWVVAGRPGTSGAHVALRVDDDATVDAVARAGRGSAGQRRAGRYGVTLTDPAGNTVEVFS